MKQSLIAPPGTQPRKAMQLNRTCACGTHTGGGECGHCRSQRDTARHALVPRGGGMRLPSDTRRRMEAGFGESFEDVRVHAGTEANRSAHQVHARAFTVGTNVVLSARANPGSDPLMAHELAHVVQQRHAYAPAALDVGASHSPLEGQARTAAADVAMGRHAGALSAAPAQLVQREEETGEPEADTDPDANVSLGGVDNPRVDDVMSTMLTPAGWHLVREVLRGFVGATSQANASGRLSMINDRMIEMQLSPWQMAKFGAGINWGLIRGLLSPVTDLFHLIKGGLGLLWKTCMFLGEKTMDAFLYPDEMMARANRMMQRITDVGAAAFEGIETFIRNPREGLKQLNAMMDVMAAAGLKQARGIGRSAAEGLMGLGELSPFALGEKIGYIVGMITVQILLLVFTEAIGNALSAAARAFAQGGQFVASKISGLIRAAMGLARSMLNAVQAMGGKFMKAFEKAGRALGRLFDEALDFFGKLLPDINPHGVPADGNVLMMNGPKGDIVVPAGVRTNPVKTADLYPAKAGPTHPPKPGGLTPIPEGVKIQKIPEDMSKRPKPEPIKPKESAPPAGYDDVLEGSDISKRRTPGGRRAPTRAQAGNWADKHFEDIEDLLKDHLDELVPPGQIKIPIVKTPLPKGLTAQHKLDVRDLGGKPRPDRLDWTKGEVIEIKPDTPHWRKQGMAEAKQYAAWLDKSDPLPNGRKWIATTAHYDLDKLIEVLKKIGYFEK